MSTSSLFDMEEHTAKNAPVGGGSQFRSRVLQAGTLSLLVHLVGQALRVVSSLVMTRLLAPEMFGVIALASAVQVTISLLSDIGLRQAVIQSPRGDRQEMLNTAWTLQIVRGWLIWLTCSVVALTLPAIVAWGWLPRGSVYAASELPWVIVAASFTAVIVGFQSTKSYTADRALSVRRQLAIEVVSQVVGLIVTLALGWWTRSIWSMVIGGMVGAMVTVLLGHAFLLGPPDRLAWDIGSVRELLRYGRWVLASSLLYVLASNGDRLMLGAWVDASTLGLYALALNLASMVDGAVGRLLAGVAMPALSEVARHDRTRLRSVYFRLRLPLDLALVAVSGLLFAAGSPIVALLYDSRYAPAGQMLQVLSISLLFTRFGLAGSAYLALGEPQNLTWMHAVKLLALFIAMPVAFYVFGMQGLLFAVALHAASTLPMIYYFNRRHDLNSLRFELLVLLAWPVGYGAGSLFAMLVGH
jgi:O-antigen/teichoic acid export membrane protein